MSRLYYGGVTKSLTGWAEFIGITQPALTTKLNRLQEKYCCTRKEALAITLEKSLPGKEDIVPEPKRIKEIMKHECAEAIDHIYEAIMREFGVALATAGNTTIDTAVAANKYIPQDIDINDVRNWFAVVYGIPGVKAFEHATAKLKPLKIVEAIETADTIAVRKDAEKYGPPKSDAQLVAAVFGEDDISKRIQIGVNEFGYPFYKRPDGTFYYVLPDETQNQVPCDSGGSPRI